MTMLVVQDRLLHHKSVVAKSTLKQASADTLHHYVNKTSAGKEIICKHCKISFEPVAGRPSEFCCHGCHGAWEIVQGLGLSSFYTMSAQSDIRPAETLMQDYSIYDSAEFQAGFVRNLDEKEGGFREATLSIDGISCFACVWLIRQAIQRNFKNRPQLDAPIPAEQDPVVGISINQTTGAASLTWSSGENKLSTIIQFIEALGYNASPHRPLASSTNQSLLIRIGVGLFVMMNVSSFALAEYFIGNDGMDAGLESFFRWISLALTMLSLAWTGQEFFINTWRSVKARTPNIDGPILIGLLSAFVWSVDHTITNHGPVYYDSICAIVALVMTGRFTQQNVLRRNQTRMSSIVSPRDGWVLVRRDKLRQDVWVPIRSSALKKGDHVRVLPGEMFPLAVTCASGCGEVSFEQLRGEADWKTIQKGGEIPAGALNGATPIEALATQNGSESYTEGLARSVERAIHEKGRYHQWSDRAAWVLFLVVLTSAAAVMLVVGRVDLEDSVRRTVALLLVACPCTFAIGVPLTFGTAMTQALRDGILFKSQRSLEKLATIRHIIFDKTGTLTEGSMAIQSWAWESWADDPTKMAVFGRLGIMDQFSSHHIARAVAKFSAAKALVTTDQPTAVSESQGNGLSMTFDEVNHATTTVLVGKYEYMATAGVSGLGSPPDAAGTLVALNGRLIATLLLDDITRVESSSLIRELKNIGCEIEILSGDSSQRSQHVADELLIDKAMTHSEATPASKLKFIIDASKTTPLVMVGNGLNDAAAMSHSAVSIAVAGASSAAMNGADICLLKSDITLVATALHYAITARRRMLAVACIAFFYNSLGLTLAAFGYVTPVVAAILMPLSSLTITRVATSWAVKPDVDRGGGNYWANLINSWRKKNGRALHSGSN
jgi:P-type Cu2+ transporter